MVDARANGDSVRKKTFPSMSNESENEKRSVDLLLWCVTFIDFEVRKDANVFYLRLLFELNVDQVWLRSIGLPICLEIIVE